MEILLEVLEVRALRSVAEPVARLAGQVERFGELLCVAVERLVDVDPQDRGRPRLCTPEGHSAASSTSSRLNRSVSLLAQPDDEEEDSGAHRSRAPGHERNDASERERGRRRSPARNLLLHPALRPGRRGAALAPLRLRIRRPALTLALSSQVVLRHGQWTYPPWLVRKRRVCRFRVRARGKPPSMPRGICSGSVTFGLVNVPIRVYSAID